MAAPETDASFLIGEEPEFKAEPRILDLLLLHHEDVDRVMQRRFELRLNDVVPLRIRAIDAIEDTVDRNGEFQAGKDSPRWGAFSTGTTDVM